jgi:molybdopterin-guanine dinucleotide biosynthesis protein A
MIGVILAGGLGRRMGGGKPARELHGRPLAAYPADALHATCDRVALVAKRDSELPLLDGVERWDEPDDPRHPLTGIVYALECAGESVLVCAADMPRVTADACRELIGARAIATSGGRLQPLLGVYRPEWLDVLRAAPPDAPLTRTVGALDPPLVELPEEVVLSVDTPDALRATAALPPEPARTRSARPRRPSRG